MEQPFIDGFLKAEAEARESMISEQERQIHLARQFCKYDNTLKVCKNENTRKVLEKAKRDVIKLMERS